MKKMTRLLPLLLLSQIIITPLLAQQLDRVQGEILVQLEPEVNPRIWAMDFERLNGKFTQFNYKKVLSPPMRAYAFTFDFTTVNEYHLLATVRRHPQVVMAQFNHLVQMRAIPDDPQFEDQWQYINIGQSGGTPGADLDIEQAWDITTGGITADGDTIVVCAIDGGLDLNHEDFEDNHWLNHAEIPNNGIDDDQNGYVDDYRGWSITSNSDNIDDIGGIPGHGTSVAGIIGAKGNNGVGVAGISWKVKVMIIKNNFSTNEAAVLEAYTYPLIMRMLYNESNGAKGAYVVATNSSWGRDLGNPADAPLWCAFYDTLGVHGILNCGATINSNINVDEQGDLPTACPSDYLISVTNVNDDDEKVNGAGYGATMIDLGAFGSGTWTTDANNDYDDFGGTSGATPHVSGTVGLLYSAPCPSFMALAKSDPGAAALLMKQYILDGVDPNASLDTITVTGGRLNINNSLQLMLANCGDCLPPSSLRATQLTGTSALLSWNRNDSINTVDLRWRALGDVVWTEVSNVGSSYPLNGLLACTEYEFQLKAHCSSETLDFGNSHLFQTDGCCELPEALRVNIDSVSLDNNLATWNSVLAAESFNLRIRALDSTEWVTSNTMDTFFILPNLMACTLYEIQIQTLCGGLGSTEYSSSLEFRTFGCGPCVESDYCIPINLQSDEEWIGSVNIGALSNESGTDSGFGNYTSLPTATFQVGQTYPIALDPDFLGFPFSQDFHIWIDLNQDALFTPNELVFESPESSGSVHMGEITIPANAAMGNTRLRVAMQHQGVTTDCLFNPGSMGEVEDYCINVIPETTCSSPGNFDTLSVGSNIVELEWDVVEAALSYFVRFKKTSETQWSALSVLNNNILLSNLEKCEEYEAQIRPSCSNSQGVYSASLVFNTDCVNKVENPLEGVKEVNIYPNPFTSAVIISLETNQLPSSLIVQLTNTLGIVLQHKTVETSEQGQTQISLDGNALAPGIYFIQIGNENKQTITRKVVKF